MEDWVPRKAVRADHRDLGQPAQPADVVADPVAIAGAEQRRVGGPTGDQRGQPWPKHLRYLKPPVACAGLGALDPQHAGCIVDVAHDSVGDLAGPEPHEERHRSGKTTLVALAERGLDEAASLVDVELGFAACARAGDLEPIGGVARQPALADAPGRERPGGGELADRRALLG